MLTSLLSNRRTVEDLSSKGMFRSSGQKDEINDNQQDRNQLHIENYPDGNHDYSDGNDGSDYDNYNEKDINGDDNDDNIEDLDFIEEEELSIIAEDDASYDMSHCTVDSYSHCNSNRNDDNKLNEIEIKNNNYYNKYVHDIASFENVSDEVMNEFDDQYDDDHEEIESETKEDRWIERDVRGKVLRAPQNESINIRSESKPPPYSECSISDSGLSVSVTPISTRNPPPPPIMSLPLPPPYTWSASANLNDRKLDRRTSILSPKIVDRLSSSSATSTSSSPLFSSSSTPQSCNGSKSRSTCFNTNQPVFSRSSSSKMQSSRPSYRNVDRSPVETSPSQTNFPSPRDCTTADKRTNGKLSPFSESKSSVRSTRQFSPSTFSKDRGLERVLGGTKGVFRRLDTTNSFTQYQHQHSLQRRGYSNQNTISPFRDDYNDDGRSIYGYSKLNRITEHSMRQQVSSYYNFPRTT